MTLYPPSNWVESTVPADNGGCGQPHRRPYVDGVPTHPYGLECAPCEDFLRKHMGDQWSATITEIPETYDEKLIREKAEKTGKLDRERQLATALESLAPLGELPAALTRLVAQLTGTARVPGITAGLLECVNGHATPAPAKFCPECAAPLSSPAPAAAIGAPPQRAAEAAPKPEPVKAKRLRDARLEELQALAAARGLDTEGKRPDLINRLSAAGVTSNDLSALAAA